jgi:predicted porin
MKKQLLAGAIASVVGIPMAASADVTVYGHLHYGISSMDLDANAGIPADTDGDDATPNGFDGTAVSNHDSFFGIKGSEDLGNGLSALFQMEFSISGDSLGGVANDHNTFVALAGDWGVAGIGQVDTPLNGSTGDLELFDQTMGDYDQLGFDNITLSDALFYMSPDWNGFSFVAGIGMPSTSLDSDGVEALSVSATYSNGPWFATLAYEDVSGEYVNDLLGGGVGNSHDFDKWRLGLGYTANGWHVGFIYEDREIDSIDTIAGFAGVSDDSDSWQLSTSYTAGNNTFKIAYGEVSEWGMNGTDAPYVVDDVEQWSVGIDHKLSNRTKLYAVYSDYSDGVADRDWDAVSVGIVHDF